MNEKSVNPVSVPKVLAIDFERMPVLGAALEKRINYINTTRHVPVNVARYIVELIEKDVSTSTPAVPAEATAPKPCAVEYPEWRD